MDGRGRFRYMRALCVFLVFLFCGSLFLSELGAIGIASVKGSSQTVGEEEKEGKRIIVLDAGHGGEDGGAVGVSGVLEKDLNLAIAFCMKEMLEEKGYTFLSAEIAMIPQNTVDISDPETVEKVQRFLDNLEDNDDVQEVYHNGNLPEEDE